MSSLPHLVSLTLGDQAYEAVRQAIMKGTLARGTKVTERGLAESLNISPTPVREALRRLEQDQLVVRVGPRSVQIADFDGQELREITMIENALRALAARLAAEKASDSQIEAMRAALERAETASAKLVIADVDVDDADTSQSLDDIGSALRELHATIDRASESPTLIHMLRMVEAFNYDERRRISLNQLSVDPGAVAERFNQHRLIFDAIARHDADEAERLMRSHSQISNETRLAARRAH